MSQHPITITGHLTQDPKTVRLKSGLIKTTIRIASSRRVRDLKQNNGDGESPQNSQNNSATDNWKDIDLLFLDIEVWDQFAINVRKSLSKGMPIIALGSLMTNSWEDSHGQLQSRTIMRANFLGLDLSRYAVASKKNDAIHNAAGIEDPGFTSSDSECPIDDDQYQAPYTNPPLDQSGDPSGDQSGDQSGDLPDALKSDAERGATYDDVKRSHDARAGLNMGNKSRPTPATIAPGVTAESAGADSNKNNDNSGEKSKEKAMV